MGQAQSELLWDDVISVPALSVGPHQWLTCPKGQTFIVHYDERPGINCYIQGQIMAERGAAPLKVSVQEMLYIHFSAPAGYTAKAIGVLPALAVGQQMTGYATGRKLVAYKLIAR